MWGGELVLKPNSTIAECEYCGTTQTVPSADNEKKLVLFERAERLRRSCEFDKASSVYESIVADFRQEAEAYWGLVLCKYGIEYVDDPATGKKVPTCHRTSFDSVMDDPNFEQTLENADVVARKVYREEAKVIEELRKGIIEVSSKEDPYDIFICYKETAENGERTLDSVLAQDMYEALTEKGYRVFFSRITLEDKLGQEYEPYIFAALNSSKVMLAVGTDYEYFNAVWVKNEWSRFLQLMAAGQKKTLIPCYKGIDAYDMPKEFAKLQAQDMGKVGAMQDLLRGIDKILAAPKAVKVESGVQESDVQKSIVYNSAMEKLQEKKKKRKIAAYKEAIEKLESISGWKDADEQLAKAKSELKKLQKKKNTKTVIMLLLVVAVIGGIAFVVIQQQRAKEAEILQKKMDAYNAGVLALEELNYEEAAYYFGKAGDYSDADDLQSEAVMLADQEKSYIPELYRESSWEDNSIYFCESALGVVEVDADGSGMSWSGDGSAYYYIRIGTWEDILVTTWHYGGLEDDEEGTSWYGTIFDNGNHDDLDRSPFGVARYDVESGEYVFFAPECYNQDYEPSLWVNGGYVEFEGEELFRGIIQENGSLLLYDQNGNSVVMYYANGTMTED